MATRKLLRKSVYVSKRTGKVKVVTDISIDLDLYERAIQVAQEVYGVQRGALSLAVQEALESWLLAHTTAHRKVNPRYQLRQYYNAVLEVIEQLLGMVPISIPQHTFENAIMEGLNVKDRRTIRSWLHRFYVAGLIKPLTVDVKEEKDWDKNKAIELVARQA